MTLVKNADKLLHGMQKVLGNKLTGMLLKLSFFGHFCAGEDKESIRPTVKKLNDANVRCILDYAAEADVTTEEKRESARVGVVSARTYDYLGEAECDVNCQIFLKCMEAAMEQDRGFVAVKLTALCRPVLLERMSTLILTIREMWTANLMDIKQERMREKEQGPDNMLGDGEMVAPGGLQHEKMESTVAHYGDMVKDHTVRIIRKYVNKGKL